MTWVDDIQDYMNRDENNDSEDTTMNETQERTIEQRGENGVDEIRVDDLIGETVSETCKVCRRSLPDDGVDVAFGNDNDECASAVGSTHGDRSELFHITALHRGSGSIQTTSFCEHCRPPHTIDVETVVKSSGTTPRSAYVYYEIENVLLHHSEIDQ